MLTNAATRMGLTLLLIAYLISCAAPQSGRKVSPAAHRGQPSLTSSSLEKEIHILINEERWKHGLPLLAWNDALAGVAKKHSLDMAKRNYFSHYSPEGHDFLFRYKQEGYACGVHVGRTIYLGAENIALNNLYDSVTTVNGAVASYDWNSQKKIAETTVQGWMNSPGHRKNILTPHFKSEGLGVVVSPDDKVYITQNFC
jgi:uncharacterized protein YkwD